ncbi:fimbrial protein [Escherichia albertii]|uniref:fimbrial protein n=1 Tax=Escherichia albertii TaxID=208962 RepID=UPI00235E5304|nr:fimbrial protein [Escherichia albertii]WDC11648.1 fimbrial protein [Escherichia albertii]
MKKTYLFASIICSISAINTAHANNTIEFIGEITDSTCDVKLEGPSSTTVTLPTIASSQLPAADTTAGRTQFALLASNCVLNNGKTKVAAFFNASTMTGPDANNVDSASGYLNNLATGTPATNVQLRLNDSTSNKVIKVGYTDQVTEAGYVTVDGDGKARMPYSVEYYATASGVTAGAVRSVVVYDLMYQ